MEFFPCITLAILATLSFAEGYVTCYYNSEAVSRPSKGHFTVENIDPFLCDEIIYCYAGIDDATFEILVLNPYVDLYDNNGEGGYNRFTNLKSRNSALKTTLSVGGWDQGSETFSSMASDALKRSRFISSAIDLLVLHNFDGLDIDWKYPTRRGGEPNDKDNFVTLLQELRAALDAQGMSLTVAVSPIEDTIDAAYDVPAINGIVDRIHLMTYDFHGPWEDFTHHHSPLYAHPLDSAGNISLNVDYAVAKWLSLGASPYKVIMGIPTFARCYHLESSANTGFYAPVTGPGRAGPYTMKDGYMSYNEICEFQSSTSDWVTEVDPDMNEPYTFRLGTMIWCSFEDPDSTAKKAGYAKLRLLGGFMVESLDTDDFLGHCEGSQPYALVNSMKDAFDAATSTSTTSTTTTDLTTSSTSTTTTSTTSSTSTTTTSTNTPPIDSTTPGTIPNCTPGDIYYVPGEYCNEFWTCSLGTPIFNTCEPGLYWNPDGDICDDPSNVDTSSCIIP